MGGPVDVQTRPVLIVTRNEERYAKRPAHNALLALCALAKPQRQVAYRLGAALHSQLLVVVEGVVLALDSCVLDHASCIGLQTRHGASNVAVNFDNLLHGARLEKGRGYALFYAENYTFARSDLCLCEYTVRRGVERRERKHTPIAVEPSLMASSEYSTWKRRPSGEKVLCDCELAALGWAVYGVLT
jgi:hypothetical protein